MRTALVCFTGIVLVFALNSEASIFKMVESAYKVTLVAAFIPLVAGLYWKHATTQGAMAAIVAGLITWIGLELFGRHNDIWPPQLIGLVMAGAGMVAGSLLPPFRRTSPTPSRDAISIT
jgi:Na+/proline symporter